jgi:Enoyl-CoA hydratase/isomerase
VSALSVRKLFGSEASQTATEYALASAGAEGLAHPSISARYSASAMSVRSAGLSPAEPPKSNATSLLTDCWACPETRGLSVYNGCEVADRIATITLNRPEAANAPNPELLDELDAAWTRAAEDNVVSVIVLRANGKHFSAGHDLRGGGHIAKMPPFALRQAKRAVNQTRAGFLCGNPVRVRHSPDRARQCAGRQRMAGAGEPRRDESQHEVTSLRERGLPSHAGVPPPRVQGGLCLPPTCRTSAVPYASSATIDTPRRPQSRDVTTI